MWKYIVYDIVHMQHLEDYRKPLLEQTTDQAELP